MNPATLRLNQSGIRSHDSKMEPQLDALLHGDNLEVLRSLPTASVDLAYLDPPFCTGRDFGAFDDRFGDGARSADASDLSACVASLVEVAGKAHGASMASYMSFLAVRRVEVRRVLKSTGSVYVHVDPTASHYVKTLMDCIYGSGSFRNEIVWRRTSNHNRSKRWAPIHDTILFYAPDGYTWNRILIPMDPEYIAKAYSHNDGDGHGRYRLSSLTGPGERFGDTGLPWRGIDPSAKSRHWEVPPDRSLPAWFSRPEGYSSMLARERLDVLDAQCLIYWPQRGTVPSFKRYLLPDSGRSLVDFIGDLHPVSAGSLERNGYPTQKPLALLERIVLASSSAGDVILDPFCGSGTSLVAAQRNGRRYVGIDANRDALKIAAERLRCAPESIPASVPPPDPEPQLALMLH